MIVRLQLTNTATGDRYEEKWDEREKPPSAFYAWIGQNASYTACDAILRVWYLFRDEYKHQSTVIENILFHIAR